MAALLLILQWHPLVFREHERLGVGCGLLMKMLIAEDDALFREGGCVSETSYPLPPEATQCFLENLHG